MAKKKKPKVDNSRSAQQARRMKRQGILGSTAKASAAAAARNNPIKTTSARTIKRAQKRRAAILSGKAGMSPNMRNAMRRGARARLGGGKRVAGSSYKH